MANEIVSSTQDRMTKTSQRGQPFPADGPLSLTLPSIFISTMMLIDTPRVLDTFATETRHAKPRGHEKQHLVRRMVVTKLCPPLFFLSALDLNQCILFHERESNEITVCSRGSQHGALADKPHTSSLIGMDSDKRHNKQLII